MRTGWCIICLIPHPKISRHFCSSIRIQCMRPMFFPNFVHDVYCEIHRAYYFTPPPFPVLAAILRAATALGFDTYRAFAVKLLENAWSSALTDLTTETKA